MNKNPDAMRLGSDESRVACVVLAHNDPVQVRRLINALDPFPVFLHCDSQTQQVVFDEMTTDLPSRCRLVYPRQSSGWGNWDIVSAELAGYRMALSETNADHILVLSGSDYPLVSTVIIQKYLQCNIGLSIAVFEPLPFAAWGASGGLSRLRYRHWAWRKHMIRLPVPRQLPTDVTPAGGAVQKVLSRQHASLVVSVAELRPDLVKFWRRSWCADETFVASMLSSRALGGRWPQEHIEGSLWWIGWDGTRRKSPPWVSDQNLALISGLRSRDSLGATPTLFARKFATDINGAMLDVIDNWRAASEPVVS